LRLEVGIADCVIVNRPADNGAPSVHAVVYPGGARRRRTDAAGRAPGDPRRQPTAGAPQRIAGFTLWASGDFPRTSLQKVKRHEVLRALAGEAQPPTVAPVTSTPANPFARLARLLTRLGATDTPIAPEIDLGLDLELDSLSRVELAVLIEEEFGVALEDGDVEGVDTAGELLALIEAGVPAAPVVFPAGPCGCRRGSPARCCRARCSLPCMG